MIQGILVGFGLAIATAQITAKIKAAKVNGWITMFGCGVPGNGMLLRAACALALIIGAGYIGMEMAESLTKRGVKVHIVEFAESVMPSIDSDLGQKVHQTLVQKGITIDNGITKATPLL